MSQALEIITRRTLDRDTSLAKSDSLDQKLAPPLRRSLSKKEFLDLIALADSLRQFDDRKRDGTILNNIDGIVSVVVAYEVAESLGITSDYVDIAMNLLHPSREIQVADLRKHGTTATLPAVVKQYAQDLTQVLRK